MERAKGRRVMTNRELWLEGRKWSWDVGGKDGKRKRRHKKEEE